MSKIHWLKNSAWQFRSRCGYKIRIGVRQNGQTHSTYTLSSNFLTKLSIIISACVYDIYHFNLWTIVHIFFIFLIWENKRKPARTINVFHWYGHTLSPFNLHIKLYIVMLCISCITKNTFTYLLIYLQSQQTLKNTFLTLCQLLHMSNYNCLVTICSWTYLHAIAIGMRKWHRK